MADEILLDMPPENQIISAIIDGLHNSPLEIDNLETDTGRKVWITLDGKRFCIRVSLDSRDLKI